MEKNSISVEELHKEIDLIQACISRMSSNSFYLKGWLISIVSVLVILSPEDTNKLVVVVVSFLVTCSFWYLDAFFLRTERLYRKLYEWVLVKRVEGSRELQYNLNPHRFDADIVGIVKIMFSKTLCCFYGIVILIIIAIAIYYKFIN